MSVPAPVVDRLDISRTPPVPFGRLVGVEMRKMVDTRAGRWLLIAIVVATASVLAVFPLTAAETDRNFFNFLAAAAVPQSLLLPVLGILLITSEYGQRTTLTTFSLSPRRGEVLRAKVAAACVVGLVALAGSFALAGLVTEVAGGPDAWANVGLDTVVKVSLGEVLTVLWGLAFGLLFLNGPAAIVLFYLIPQVLMIVAQFSHTLASVNDWINLTTTSNVLFGSDPISGEQWAHLVVSSLIWVAAPMAIGWWRVLTTEVK